MKHSPPGVLGRGQPWPFWKHLERGRRRRCAGAM